MATIIRVSVGSWRKKDSPAVNRRIRVKGLLNWESRILRASYLFFGLRIFARKF
nr:hypothetical protein [Methanosarcina sp. WWM596]